MLSFPRTVLAVFSLLAFGPPGFSQPAKSDGTWKIYRDIWNAMPASAK